MVIFNTTDFSNHGHPDPVTCPDNRSRKSIALFYYTSGRPKGEVIHHNRITTNFRSRQEQDSREMKNYNRFINLLTDITPPAVLKLYKKWAD
jgi:long-subunit acyl-CoA synthetase (AMP-forming)